MSRCFPFPPPGYETTRTVDEARIQSMKLLKEKEIAKKERKKQKRHEKKEKRKAKKSIEIEHEKNDHKRRRKDEGCQEYEKRRSNEKMEENGAQQFDKSSLTEECRHLENPSDSTESTQNSSQRQKQSSSPEGAHDAGSIIRIRLPLPKKKNSRCSSETNPFTSHQTCSAFGIDSSIPEQCEMPERAKASSENSDSSTPLVSNRDVSLQHGENGIHVTSEALKSCTELPNYDPWPLDLEMKNLLNVIDPPSVHLVGLEEDQEWLYEGKSKKSFKGETCSGEVRFRGTDMWPRGCYLPEADVYALPFSVPF